MRITQKWLTFPHTNVVNRSRAIAPEAHVLILKLVSTGQRKSKLKRVKINKKKQRTGFQCSYFMARKKRLAREIRIMHGCLS